MSDTTTGLGLLVRLAREPEAIALRDATSARSWQQWLGQALAWRDQLVEQGLAPGDHIGLRCGNRADYYEVLLGALLAGVWVTPLNTHLTRPEQEYILQDAGARVLFHDGVGEGDPLTSAPLIDLLDPQQRPATAIEATDITARLHDLLDAPCGGLLMYTSGTTGRPKGVKRAAPGNVGATLGAWARLAEAIGLGGPGAHLVCGPLYHAAPGLYAFYELLCGSPLVILPRFDTGAVREAINAHDVRRTHWVPTMCVRLLRELRDRELSLSGLELILHGAAPMAPAVKREMIDWLGPIFVEYWGGSESGIITRIDAQQWLAHPGSVGRALPQFEVRALAEGGQPLAAGEVGLLFARHREQAQPFSYYNDDEKTASAYRGDWFTLGDMGHVDAAGFVFLADRRSNLIISGGVNIYPAEIEGVLLGHPQVMDAAVVGVPDAEWGQRVHAVVQTVDALEGEDTALGEALIEYASASLARFKLPRTIEFRAALPRVDSGKLYRGRLSVVDRD